MRSFLLVASLCLGAVLLVSAVPDITTDFQLVWGSASNEEVFTHVLDGSGSGEIYVGGSTTGATGIPGSAFTAAAKGDSDAYVVKFSPRGAILWMRVLQSEQRDRIFTTTSDAQGNLYACGTTSGQLGGTGGLTPLYAGYYDSFCAKYTRNGDLEWLTNSFRHPAQYVYDAIVASVARGTFLYVVQSITGSGITGVKTVVKKLRQSDGVELWSTQWGAGGSDTPFFMHVDANDLVYVSGGTNSALIPDVIDENQNTIPGFTGAGNFDGFLLVLDGATGKLRLNVPMQTSGNDVASSVVTDGLGGVYVVGGTDKSMNGEVQAGTSVWNIFVVKFQLSTVPAGSGTIMLATRQWTRQFGASSSGRSILYDGVGGLYVSDLRDNCATGYPYDYNYQYQELSYTPSYCSKDSDRFLRKLDTNGNLIWTYGFNGAPTTISLDNQGGLITTGIFGTTLGGALSYGGSDGFIRKQTLSYNCSCSDLQSLVSEVQDLLNIAPVF